MASNNKKNSVSFYNSHLVSVVSISLVLFLLGLILITSFLGRELSHYVKENISISMILTENISDIKIKQMRNGLERQPYVKSTEYISKEQASLEMQRELGEDPKTFLGFNPFQASIEVKLKSEYIHADSLSVIEKRIGSMAGVSEVQYRKDMMQMVNQNIQRIGFVLFMLFVVLVLITLVLINNTVRILIYSKRFLIYTMRLVGATPAFIRKPFVRRNIINGFVAGLIAIIMLVASLYYVQLEFIGMDEILSRDTLLLIYGIVLAAGVLLSVLATHFAVNRYLRMAKGRLYYI
jgi:cell division transport system permease protein